MPPAERRRWMDAAEFRGLRQTHALDHRLGVIQPLLLLAQMRHRRLGQSVERAPASFAAISQKPVRTTPADDLAARAMRTALTLDPLDAGRSERILAPLACRFHPGRRIGGGLLNRRQRPSVAPRSSPKSPTAKPKNPQTSSNQSSIQTSLNQINR